MSAIFRVEYLLVEIVRMYRNWYTNILRFVDRSALKNISIVVNINLFALGRQLEIIFVNLLLVLDQYLLKLYVYIKIDIRVAFR